MTANVSAAAFLTYFVS